MEVCTLSGTLTGLSCRLTFDAGTIAWDTSGYVMSYSVLLSSMCSVVPSRHANGQETLRAFVRSR